MTVVVSTPPTRQAWHLKGVRDAETYADCFPSPNDTARLARRLATVIFDWRDADGRHNSYARGFIGRLSTLVADRLEGEPAKAASGVA